MTDWTTAASGYYSTPGTWKSLQPGEIVRASLLNPPDPFPHQHTPMPSDLKGWVRVYSGDEDQICVEQYMVSVLRQFDLIYYSIPSGTFRMQGNATPAVVTQFIEAWEGLR